MDLRFYAAWWGRDHLGLEAMVESVAGSGYDGIETFVPAGEADRRRLVSAVERAGLTCIAHQFEARGDDATCRRELADNLRRAGELSPVLVNSHTGRDHWTPARVDALIEVGEAAAADLGVPVCHETHRSRFPYSAAVTAGYIERHPGLRLTADLSHWVCVSESLLDDQDDLVELALRHTLHTHARVGSPQSAQVPDVSHPRWRHELDTHVRWWRRIRDHLRAQDATVMTITCEIGPPPYMPVEPESGAPAGDFAAQNVWLREHLRVALASNGATRAVDA